MRPYKTNAAPFFGETAGIFNVVGVATNTLKGVRLRTGPDPRFRKYLLEIVQRRRVGEPVDPLTL